MKICRLVVIVLLTVLMAGCTSKDQLVAEIQKVERDPTLSVSEKSRRTNELANEIYAQQNLEQWIPSEIIIGFGLLVLAGGLTFKRLQNPPLTGAPSGKGKPGAQGAAKTPAKQGDAKGANKTAPAPVSRYSSWEVPSAPVKVPEAGQEAVDAIPEDQRGVSFFSSRPLSREHLVEITMRLEDRDVTVWATREEADAAASGRLPRVRALSMNGETRPWYGWHAYDPFRDYWRAEASDWVWRGGVVIASWLAMDRIDPELVGYLSPLPDEGSIGDAAASADVESAPQRLHKTPMILNAQDKPSFAPQKMRASDLPAVTNASAVTVGSPAPEHDESPRPPSTKTGLRHLWIYQIRCHPKKAGRAALQSLD